MRFQDFIKNFDSEESIILLEGKRDVSPKDKVNLVKLGELLCKKMKHAKFRSGNAKGADYFFSTGVSKLNPERLELILPYTSQRNKYLLSDNYSSMDDIIWVNEPKVINQTKSNPKNKNLIESYVNGDRGRFGIKASYLLRDTVKVSGTSTQIRKASFAIFYDDLEKPKSGGTGHTMNMCNLNTVPYIDQTVWMKWL